MGALSLCLILRAIFHPPVEHWAHAIAMPKIYSTSQTHAHTNVGMKQKYKKKGLSPELRPITPGQTVNKRQ